MDEGGGGGGEMVDRSSSSLPFPPSHLTQPSTTMNQQEEEEEDNRFSRGQRAYSTSDQDANGFKKSSPLLYSTPSHSPPDPISNPPSSSNRFYPNLSSNEGKKKRRELKTESSSDLDEEDIGKT